MARQGSKNRPSVATAQLTRVFHVDGRHLYLKANAYCLSRCHIFPHLLYFLKIKTKIVNTATYEVRSVIRFLNANNFRWAEFNEQIFVACVVKV